VADPFAAEEVLSSTSLISSDLLQQMPLDITERHQLPFDVYMKRVDPELGSGGKGDKEPLIAFTSAFLEKTREIMLKFGMDWIQLHGALVVDSRFLLISQGRPAGHLCRALQPSFRPFNVQVESRTKAVSSRDAGQVHPRHVRRGSTGQLGSGHQSGRARRDCRGSTDGARGRSSRCRDAGIGSVGRAHAGTRLGSLSSGIYNSMNESERELQGERERVERGRKTYAKGQMSLESVAGMVIVQGKVPGKT
jgi:hypothetical protein